MFWPFPEGMHPRIDKEGHFDVMHEIFGGKDGGYQHWCSDACTNLQHSKVYLYLCAFGKGNDTNDLFIGIEKVPWKDIKLALDNKPNNKKCSAHINGHVELCHFASLNEK